jgi:cell division initiation protein
VFLTPPEIQHQTLKSGRGYDREQVDKLLEQIASSYEQVWLERDELRSRLSSAEDELASLRETERLLSDTLVTAQRAAEDVRSGARRDAERIKQEALAEVEPAKAAAEIELADMRAQIERFRFLERELRSNLRSFLEGALREIGAAGAVQEDLPETLVDAVAPQPATVERDDG